MTHATADRGASAEERPRTSRGRDGDAGGAIAPDAVVEVRGLRQAYGGRAVLRDVSLTARRGEIVALLGPNGAGKTTTVEMIEGFRRPDAGRVRVLGVDPATAGRSHRARVGLMLQGGGGIDPRLTPREVVGLYGRLHVEPRDVDEVLAAVGLTEAVSATRYRRLSGGERQRVGLALALVGRPEVAILDEPTAGMDVEARGATRALLAGLRAAGVTIVLTSHDLGDVERLADRIAILDRGRVVASGTVDELSAGTVPGIRFRLRAALRAEDRLALERALAGDRGESSPVTIATDGEDGRYSLDGGAADAAMIERLAAWCAAHSVLILELRVGGATLEERYLELTGQGDERDAGGGVGSAGDADEPDRAGERAPEGRSDRGQRRRRRAD